MARSSVKLNFSDVTEFHAKLSLTASLTERMADDWQSEHGEKWAQQMRATVPVGPGEPVHLRDSIRQVEPGGITMGGAFWWRFLEYGTTRMAPQPFVNPAMKKIRTPARKDATVRAIRLLRGRA